MELRSKRILVVDDEPLLLALVERILSGAGYEVVVTVDANEALHLIEHNEYALVLSDVRMPTLSGPDLAKRMRFTNAPRVLFMSGSSNSPVVDGRRNTGFLKKPFRRTELLDSVRSLVGA